VAEAGEGEAAEQLTGFEKHATSVLFAVRANQEQGLLEVFRHEEAGTLNVRPKPGAATAKEAGETIMMLYDAITEELRRRGALDE
jgi:hypothetical protein